jgi:hypothetical protein
MPPTRHKPNADADIQPLNDIDDPFIGVADKDLSPDSLELQCAYIVRLLVEDVSRGIYSAGRIREKYLGNDRYKPYPWLNAELLGELIKIAANRMVNDNPVDVRLEIAAYLSSNTKLQESLWEMLDEAKSTGKPRTSVEIIRTLNQMKGERLKFLREIGVEMSEQAKDPTKPSLLPPGAIPVTDLLSEGAKILERTTVPDNFAGVLTSGDIAQDGRSRSTAGDMEDEQDPIHPASAISI